MKNRVQKERRFWDLFADRYDRFMDKNAKSTYEIVIQELKKDLNVTDNVLEIATGTGIIAFSIFEHVDRITAIDISPEMIRVAKDKKKRYQSGNIVFEVGDACDLKFEGRSFDKIICSNVLHLLFEPDKAMKEMHRVLKDNGLIYVPTYCHGETVLTRLLSGFLSIFGFKVRRRWNSAGFWKFISKNNFNLVSERLIRDKIPLFYCAARKSGKA